MQFLDCKITLSFSNQKIKDRSKTLINKGKYEVKLKFIVSLIISVDLILTITLLQGTVPVISSIIKFPEL